MMMLVKDSLMILLFASVAMSGWRYVRLAKESMNSLPDCLDTRAHFRVHTYAVVGFLVSATLGMVFSVLHLLSQNILGYPPEGLIEYGTGAAIAGILVSAEMYITHATEEEDKSHMFYIGRDRHLKKSRVGRKERRADG